MEVDPVNQETRRQHFLPQFLLKGFASRSRRDRQYVQVFQKNRTPYETNIINVAVVGDFYGRAAEGGVEDGLRPLESEHAVVLDHIRTHGLISDDRLVLGEFVRQLLVRTRHMRDLAAEMATMLTAIIGGFLRTPQVQAHLMKEIGARVRRDDAFWDKAKTLGLNFT